MIARKGLRTGTGRAEVGNLPVAGNVVEVGVFADDVAAAVEIARMTGPYRARIRCIRLDFPVGHCRRVLCRGMPAPHSRRL